ncbi:MAG: c-type cytochrome [Terriglobales bacterium]
MLSAQQITAAEAHAGSVAAGAALFSGKLRFAGGGPACIACHSTAGLPFPNGGTLGPNLTHAYTRMGAQGIDSALTTLYFPAMYPLYKTRPLTPDERANLAAFLQYSSTQPQPGTTLPVLGLALVLFVIFMLIVGYAGRNRVLGVRRNLVASARRQASLHPSPASPPQPTPPAASTDAAITGESS